jgi:hypothetical protein
LSADPRGPAARPEFAALLALLRGGEKPCPRCKGEAKPWCGVCWGSGRVAAPPDPGLAPMVADWWQQEGGDLAGLLWCYASPPEPPAVLRGEGYSAGRDYRRQDDSLRPVLAAWDDAACPARAAAVRGLRVVQVDGRPGEMRWCVLGVPTGPRVRWHPNEPAARLALKSAVLRCYDPCAGHGWVAPSSLLPAAGADAGRVFGAWQEARAAAGLTREWRGRLAERDHARGGPRRTRAEVLAARRTVAGCCDRFADMTPCDCLEAAAP